MLAHYLEVKATHPDCLVFYRMGDFYELFFDDAVAAAAALDITLTKRGKQAGQDVPMCGVPVHAAESYLARLIKAGFKVAVCEQMEDPATARKQRGNKALVRREVIRLVTPGTLTEDTLLDSRRHNYLVAIAEAQGQTGLAWLDMTTGDFCAEPVPGARLAAALARLDPGEILVPDRLIETPALYETFGDWKSVLTVQAASRFDSENARRRLEALYGVAALDALGGFGRAEIAAAGALVDYVDLTQRGKLPRLGRLRRIAAGGVMEIDAATRRNLELTRTLSGERRGSLIAVIDQTVTGGGARLLAERLAAPLTDPAAIDARLAMVAFFVDAARARDDIRGALRAGADIERALSRLTLGRGGPRDLAAIRDGLGQIGALRAALADGPLPPVPEGVRDAEKRLGHHDPLIDRLGRALAEELPLQSRDGGFIAPGYSEELDGQVRLRTEGRGLIARLEARYRDETGISSLKIRHNNVLGYFIEVTSGNADKLPSGPDSPFIHRQTMASAMRYTTVELSELETDIARAADRALALELALFDDLVGEVAARAEPIAAAARAMAELDVAAALAVLAVERDYCRPAVDDSRDFAIDGGRHPGGRGAGAGRGLRRQRLRPRPRPPAVAGHRPQHGGQEHVFAPERDDRDPGPDGQLRAREGGAARRRRPAVLPRRRGRRPRPRPLDLHGRDGRDRGDPEPGRRPRAGHPRRDRPRHGDLRRPVDRLGGGRAPARGQPLPDPVRDPLSRADRARRAAAGAVLPHHAGQGVGGRRRLPARGRAGHGGPVLRHPRRPARRPARAGGGARRGGAALAGEGRAGRRARPGWPTTCRCSAPRRRRPAPIPRRSRRRWRRRSTRSTPTR